MKIILIGCSGKMGSAVSVCADCEIIGIDKDRSEELFSSNEKIGDVILDFSTPRITHSLCVYALRTLTPLVIGTTGQSQVQLQEIKQVSKVVPVFLSGNMSIGIGLFAKYIKEIMRFSKDAQVDIIETHHIQKADVPSGTALLLAKAIQSVNSGRIIVGNCAKREKGDIHVLSRRMGKTVGEHTVIIYTENEVFTFTHSAQNRNIFALGALKACDFVLTKEKGLYSILELIEENEIH